MRTATDTVRWKDAPTHTVDVGGVDFAYRELGATSGVPVVFLHHFTAVLDDWDPRLIDGIAAHHRVIVFDNRGVGASGGTVPPTVEEMGRDAIAFIRALGLERVDLFGFSLGGGVAQMVALQAPELVRRMILAGTGPRGGDGIDEITQPVLVANGDHDLMVASSHSADMARRLPDARLTIYPDSGHGGVFQHHEKFVPAALAFLNGSGETPR